MVVFTGRRRVGGDWSGFRGGIEGGPPRWPQSGTACRRTLCWTARW